MNKARRKQLSEILDNLNKIKEALEVVLEEEEGYRDNMPENLQGSERYEKSDSVCDDLQLAVENIDDVISYVDSAKE
jgi:hypothetical protein